MHTPSLIRACLIALPLWTGHAWATDADKLYGQLEAGQCAPALSTLQATANGGDAASQEALGRATFFGHCINEDKREAATWFRKAAEQGYAIAQYKLGLLYENGLGVAKDEREAVNWYRKAAEQGHASAQNNLGFMYDNGQGVAKDEREAVNWYRKAAEQGHASAQNNLGVAYQDGTGTRRDEETALRWFEKAAHQGDAWGQRNLGHALRDGRGVSTNLIQAHAWLNLASAADEPHPNAAAERDEIGRRLNAAQLADAQRLAREWTTGAAMGKARVKVVAAPAPAPTPIQTTSLYPQRPAAVPGRTTCNTRCVNGDCYRTYGDGRKLHYQAQHKFNPFTNQWEWDSGNC